MKKLRFKRLAGAFTLVELLVVVAMLAILAALLMPAVDNKPTRAPIAHCINNLRELGFALQSFAVDNHARFPPQVSITNGGSLELISSNSPALHFQSLSNYSAYDRRMFHCPADESKSPLTNNTALTDRNLSYFISVNATLEMANTIQVGDRNLEVAGQPIKPGAFTLTTNAAIRWTREMHTKSAGTRCGNLLFVDGHAQNLRLDLAAAVQGQGLSANRLAVP